MKPCPHQQTANMNPVWLCSAALIARSVARSVARADRVIAQGIHQMRQTTVPPEGLARTLALLPDLRPSRHLRSYLQGATVRLLGVCSFTGGIAAIVLIYPLLLPPKSLAA